MGRIIALALPPLSSIWVVNSDDLLFLIAGCEHMVYINMARVLLNNCVTTAVSKALYTYMVLYTYMYIVYLYVTIRDHVIIHLMTEDHLLMTDCDVAAQFPGSCSCIVQQCRAIDTSVSKSIAASVAP